MQPRRSPHAIKEDVAHVRRHGQLTQLPFLGPPARKSSAKSPSTSKIACSAPSRRIRDGGDVLVGCADVKSGIGVLGHGAGVPCGGIRFMTPLADRQLHDLFQNLGRTHRGEILLLIQVSNTKWMRANHAFHSAAGDLAWDGGILLSFWRSPPTVSSIHERY